MKLESVSLCVHMEYTFWSHFETDRDRIVFKFFQLVWNQTDVRLVPDRLEDDECNPVSVWLSWISGRILCNK